MENLRLWAKVIIINLKFCNLSASLPPHSIPSSTLTRTGCPAFSRRLPDPPMKTADAAQLATTDAADADDARPSPS
ncbi:hypothetical protein GWI33_017740 [Rhynchophorus ferrugineus]|uniref:Uncharacterized protein n=1 Tax=Rhynchophorus ferrugineus TaxID=354439 RepID=A0A834HVJ0_RHYFE|nr:hypothetical protein GWI33_017740 [Rhynchophorus ferrugineus]